MMLHDRRAVAETSPTVFIGRRIFKNRQGNQQVARVWYAESTHGGHTHYAPLKTASLSVAIHRAHQMAEILRQTGGRRLVQQQRVIDLAELAREYLSMQVNRDRSPKTLEKYEYTLAAFVAWARSRLGGASMSRAEQFTETLFWQWHRAMIDDGCSAKTRADRMTIVKQAFKWAAYEKLIAIDPLARVRIADPPPTPQPCFEPEQVQALLDHAADPLERAVFAVLAFTGMRFGEIRALRWSDVMMPPDRPGHILVRDGGSRGRTKSGQARRIPLNPALRAILAAMPRVGERVFYSPASRRHPPGDRLLNESTWLKRLKAACARCGFVAPRQYKLHTFRHAFASMCARTNIAYRYALAWMGHSSSEILDMYFKQFDGAADEAMLTINYGR
jgi:integrase